MAPGKRFTGRLYLASAALVLTLAACTSSSKPRGELAGRYELVGVMEMGSHLRLDERGEFEAAMYYGGFDVQARGRWSVVKGQIVLSVRPTPALPTELLMLSADSAAERSHATKGDDLYRLDSFSIDAFASPIEVRWVFDDGSEQRMVWQPAPLEKMTLPQREGRDLKKLGVRIAGTGGRFEWLATEPGDRDFQVVRVLEQEGDPRSFFHQMVLTPHGNCLLLNPHAGAGCYRKH